MEFAGERATHRMQVWIGEDFAYITRKRGQGIPVLEEERKIRRELQLPEFNGRNPEGWILELEDTFHFFRLNEEAKLKSAIITLDGEALRWFEGEHKFLPFHSWQELKGQVMLHFGSSPNCRFSSEYSNEEVDRVEKEKEVVKIDLKISKCIKHSEFEDISKSREEQSPKALTTIPSMGGCFDGSSEKMEGKNSKSENYLGIFEGGFAEEHRGGGSCDFVMSESGDLRYESGSSYGGPPRGIFERGGAGGCGSGGGPGRFTGEVFGCGRRSVGYAGSSSGLSSESNLVAGGHNSYGSKGGVNSLSPEIGGRQDEFCSGFIGGCGDFVGGGSNGSYHLICEPSRREFERGGAGNSGSGGGPGFLAGKCKFGGGATTCGCVNKEGNEFIKGGSEASGSGGGPGQFLGISIGDGSDLFSGDTFKGVVRWSFWLDNFLVMEWGRSFKEYSFGLRKKTNSEEDVEGNYVFTQIKSGDKDWLGPHVLEERGRKVLEAIKVQFVKGHSNDASKEVILLESHVMSQWQQSCGDDKLLLYSMIKYQEYIPTHTDRELQLIQQLTLSFGQCKKGNMDNSCQRREVSADYYPP